MMTESQTELHKDPAELNKWRFLAAAPVADSEHPVIRSLARSLWVLGNRDARRFAELAHCCARDLIRYETDTARVGTEDIAGYTRTPKPDDAIEAWRRGADDCDAKARLFVALCLVNGLRAKMMPMWEWRAEQPGRLAHVFAAVFLEGKWEPVECTLRRARIGDEPKRVPFERDRKDWLR